MRLTVALLCCLAAGCYGSEPIGPDPTSSGDASATTGSSSSGGDAPGSLYESGSRLRADYYLGADGSKQFVAWWDIELAASCGFQNVAGTVRCLPTAAYFAGYSDAACTKPLAAAPACTVPKYAIVDAASGCNSTFAVHEAGPKYTGDSYYFPVNDVCTQVPVTAGQTLLTVGDVVPLESFVSADRVTE